MTFRPAAIVPLCVGLAGCDGTGVRNEVSVSPETGSHTDTPSDARLESLLDTLRLQAGASGAILGYAVADASPHIVASGVADLATNRRIEAGDPFFIGSASKTWTAVVVLRPAEEGRLGLDDSIDRFLPDFPRASEITVRQLLDHTSGLKDFYSYLYFRPDRDEMIRLVTRDWTRDEALDLAGRFGHWFDPGTDWSYSSGNYFVLGVIIEQVTGWRWRRRIVATLMSRSESAGPGSLA